MDLFKHIFSSGHDSKDQNSPTGAVTNSGRFEVVASGHTALFSHFAEIRSDQFPIFDFIRLIFSESLAFVARPEERFQAAKRSLR